MPTVTLTGAGLSCALGTSVDACSSTLFGAGSQAHRIELDEFSEPMPMQWFGIGETYQELSTARFYRLFESVVNEALQSAQITPEQRCRMGVFIGSSSCDVGLSEIRYKDELCDPDVDSPLSLQMVSLGYLAHHLRREFGLRGPDYTYGTACSASSNAVLGAMRQLKQGYIDHALVIGLEFFNLATLSGFHSLQLLSDDAIRPFDRKRSGMILGEGCAAVVLSCNDASHSGNTAINGGASLCDTSNVTSTNVDGKSIAAVINAALASAQLQPEDITAIKSHGTASSASDAAEANGLKQVFTALPPVCALKPFTGHTLGACGVIELVLMDAALQRGELPETAGFSTMDPALGVTPLSSPMALPERGHYLLNTFGFGGNNTALVVSRG